MKLFISYRTADFLVRACACAGLLMLDKYGLSVFFNAEKSPLRQIPKEWVSGNFGFFLAILGATAFFALNFSLYKAALRWFHSHGGRFSHILDSD